MILTTKGRYAINSIFEIIENNSERPIKLSIISKNQNISLSYLEQIFSKLKKHDIVHSVRGPGGGYKINSQRKITANDIIKAIGEKVKMTSCANENNCVKIEENNNKCKTHNIWKGLERHIENYFDSIVIHDLEG
jgi:Rrf2 family iron-sulfur cluster assembly transcriptional regulator